MALSRLAVKCVLCRGAVSIRAGNLDKMRLHIENDHDAFYNQDLFVALNFLEDFEREEIIEKAMPRMEVIFKNVEDYKKSQSQSDDTLQSVKRSLYDDLKKTSVAKRSTTNNNDQVGPRKKILKEKFITKPESAKPNLSSNEKFLKNTISSQIRETLDIRASKLPPDLHSIDISTDDDEDDKLEIVIDKVEEEDSVKEVKEKANIIEGNLKEDQISDKSDTDDGTDSQNLAQNIQTLKSQIKALQDASRNVISDTNPDVTKGDVLTNNEATTSTVNCDLCNKKYQKSSLYKHRKRCEKAQLDKSSKEDTNTSLISKDQDSSSLRDFLDNSFDNLVIDESSSALDQDQDRKNATCKVCGKSMLKGNISRHMKKFHPTNSSVMITPMKRDSQENRGEYRLEQHKCKLCKIPASSVDELRVHSSEVHSLDYDDIEQMLADEDDDEEIPFNRMIGEKQTDKVSVKRKTRDELLRGNVIDALSNISII